MVAIVGDGAALELYSPEPDRMHLPWEDLSDLHPPRSQHSAPRAVQ